MRTSRLSRLTTVLVAAYWASETIAVGVSDKTPQLQTLPSLQEQADIVNSWTEERKALVPGLLRKYGVDAWLVGDPSQSRREFTRIDNGVMIDESTRIRRRHGILGAERRGAILGATADDTSLPRLAQERREACVLVDRQHGGCLGGSAPSLCGAAGRYFSASPIHPL